MGIEKTEKIEKIEKLDYFIAAAKYCNFTKAARDCGVAQSAISQQVAALEQDLGCKLFERNGRSVSLTPQGQALYQDGLRLQALYRQAVEDARQVAFRQGSLRLGACGAAAASQLLEALDRWRQLLPPMELDLQRCDPLEGRRELERQTFDALACSWLPGDDGPQYRSLELGRRPLRVLLPQDSPLFGREALTLPQLLEQTEKLYLSSEVWQQLRALGLWREELEKKSQRFSDGDLLLPVGGLQRTAVLTAQGGLAVLPGLTDYRCAGEALQLRSVLLWRSQNSNRLLRQLLEKVQG